MATAAAPITAAIIEAIPVDIQSQRRLLRVRELWGRGRADQLEIGRLLYEERAARIAVGGRGVTGGFNRWLDETGMSRKSAYRRLAEHEVSIGIREEEDPKHVSGDTTLDIEDILRNTPSETLQMLQPILNERFNERRTNTNADVVQRVQPTSSGEMAYRPDPSAPISSIPSTSSAPDGEPQKRGSGMAPSDREVTRRLAAQQLSETVLTNHVVEIEPAVLETAQDRIGFTVSFLRLSETDVRTLDTLVKHWTPCRK